MKPLPLTLAVFSTTKGHFDHKTVYKSTIESLARKMPLTSFSERVVHIKTEEGHDEQFAQMKQFFEANGFRVYHTEGRWKHGDMSHYLEHAKDIFTLLTKREVQSQPFTLWLEDDFVFEPGECGSLESGFKQIIDELTNWPNLVTARILREQKQADSMKLVDVRGILYACKDVFSFNPNITRSRDLWHLANMFERHYKNNLGMHIERFATEAMRALNNDGTPFSHVSMNFLKSRHIGEKDFDPNVQY